MRGASEESDEEYSKYFAGANERSDEADARRSHFSRTLLAAIPLPPVYWPDLSPRALYERLIDGYGVEVPVFPWPDERGRVLRGAVHLHTGTADLRRLLEALQALDTAP